MFFGTIYTDFQEKIFAEISGKNFTTMKSLGDLENRHT